MDMVDVYFEAARETFDELWLKAQAQIDQQQAAVAEARNIVRTLSGDVVAVEAILDAHYDAFYVIGPTASDPLAAPQMTTDPATAVTLLAAFMSR